MPTPSSSMANAPSSSLFSFSCSCKDAKAILVSPSPSSSSSSSSSAAITSTSSSSSSSSSNNLPKNSLTPNPTFSGVLRELERPVATHGEANPVAHHSARSTHRRCASEGGGCMRRSTGEGRRKVRESVAVVRETEDPVGDFRSSMVAMIVEKDMETAEELRELLGWFLALNPPENHHLVLRAFAHVWEEVFSQQRPRRRPPPHTCG